MKNILVPIGTNPDSHWTLQYAVDFALEFSSTIYVMEVFNVSSKAGSLANITEKVAKSSKEHMREIINKIDSKNVKIKIATYNGEITDGLKDIDEELGIDLIIMSPRSNDIQEEFYLGYTSGRIIKRTDIPTLIVPKGTTLAPLKNILCAFRSGILKKEHILDPLIAIKEKFGAKVNLLLVKTKKFTEEDGEINPALTALSSDLTITENPTTYLGVLEHFRTKHPDLLCVFRRKRGFFNKLWESSTVLKSDFYAPIPVLVLSVKKD